MISLIKQSYQQLSIKMSARKVNRTATTQITDPIEFSTNNLIFDDPIENKIPGEENLKFHRINIGYKNDDGTVGDLVLGLDKCLSYGVQPTRDMQTKQLNGYSISIVLKDRDCPTERQEAAITALEAIVEKSKDFIMSVRTKMRRGDLERSELKKLTPLSYKKDDAGMRDESAPPMLYPKLLYGKEKVDKNGKVMPARILTTFFAEGEVDEYGQPVEVDPLMFLEKRCDVTCDVKVEGIFVGSSNIKLQCKLLQTEVRALQTGPKRLMRKFGMNSNATPQVTLSGANPLFASSPKVDDDEEDDNEEEEQPVVAKPTPVLAPSDDEEEEEKPKEKKSTRGRKTAK
jgi:hypothetical protein